MLAAPQPPPTQRPVCTIEESLAMLHSEETSTGSAHRSNVMAHHWLRGASDLPCPHVCHVDTTLTVDTGHYTGQGACGQEGSRPEGPLRPGRSPPGTRHI